MKNWKVLLSILKLTEMKLGELIHELYHWHLLIGV